jgi:hypothetical protein
MFFAKFVLLWIGVERGAVAMSSSPIKMPVELKEQCEQVLSHMQLAAACGDAEGAARQAYRLIELARNMRDKFLPDDHPRCDQCAEPLSASEAHSGEHCRQCSVLMSMGAQMANFRARAEAAQQPPVKVVEEPRPEPTPSKQASAKPAKMRKQNGKQAPARREPVQQLRLDTAIAR